jgi:hypothetical protein
MDVLTALFGRPGVEEPRGEAPQAADAARGLRKRFAQATGAHHVPERFDHHAASLYWHASDPPLSASQKSALRRLTNRRRVQGSTPLVTSWEEQDPHHGRWVLSTLAQGEYGEFKIVNSNHPRLNSPPQTRPLRPLAVHLCWGCGFAGAADAGVLQGCVALLLEDCRAALRGIRVHLHLRRLAPVPAASLPAFTPGDRWRDARHSPLRLPPARAVGLLFARASFGDLAADPRWQVSGAGARGRGWWVACLLESDLPQLGFSRTPAALEGFGTAAWHAPAAGLPEAIQHAVIIPVQPGPGAFFRVHRSSSGVSLDPLPVNHPNVTDTDYWRLRTHFMDLLLMALAQKG